MKIATFAALAVVLSSVRMASARPLSRLDIQRGVETVRPAIGECLRVARVSAMIKVRLDVSDGQVVAVQVENAGDAGGCIERVVRKARFRRAAQRTTVVYPFVSRAVSPLAAPTAASRLSRQHVSRGISAIRDAVNRCRPPGAARLLVTVRIDIANGRVASARGSSSAADVRTIACVERAVAPASFPRADAITVQYPFVLH